jgi:hypothetical protein
MVQPQPHAARPEQMVFHDLGPDDFPLRIQMLDAATRRECWSAEITGPGVCRMPGADEVNDAQQVIIRLTFPDGEATEALSPEPGARAEPGRAGGAL